MSMDLSIIIINYKSAHHVLNCIESIYKETQKYSFEIIVVDNNSEDDSEKNYYCLSEYYMVAKWL